MAQETEKHLEIISLKLPIKLQFPFSTPVCLIESEANGASSILQETLAILHALS